MIAKLVAFGTLILFTVLQERLRTFQTAHMILNATKSGYADFREAEGDGDKERVARRVGIELTVLFFKLTARTLIAAGLSSLGVVMAIRWHWMSGSDISGAFLSWPIISVAMAVAMIQLARAGR